MKIAIKRQSCLQAGKVVVVRDEEHEAELSDYDFREGTREELLQSAREDLARDWKNSNERYEYRTVAQNSVDALA